MADLNDDGFDDILSPIETNLGTFVSIALNDGNGRFVRRINIPVPSQQSGFVLPADTDLDGDLDVIVGGDPVCILVNQ